MAEGTYEYECERAELLGISPPDREQFEAAAQLKRQQDENNEALNELDIQDEQINQTSGKFDELNNILSITQQRINKFKNVCGSLTNLLKIRPAGESAEGTSTSATDTNNDGDTVQKHPPLVLTDLDQCQPNAAIVNNDIATLKQSSVDMQQKMSSQFDKLDSLVSKAENAQHSMQHQQKEMKKFLK